MQTSESAIRRFFSRIAKILSKDQLGLRLLAGYICVCGLALFLHFREVRIDVLELNTISNRYIVAQVDFEFPDYEASILSKQQAMQEVGRIYAIDRDQIRSARFEFENRLIRTKDWRSLIPSGTFEEMYKTVDELETLLLEARFTDGRTIQIAKELSLPLSFYYETISDDGAGQRALPDEFWIAIREKMQRQERFRPEAVSYAFNAFSAQSWVLEEDDALEKSIRAEASRVIPEIFTHVQAGSKILEPGERVTSRHLTMMQAMKLAISESRQLWEPLTLVSSFLLALILVVASALYFRISQPIFLRSLRQVGLVVCIVLMALVLAKLTEYALLKSSSGPIERIRYPVLVPFASLLICILLSPRLGLFVSMFLSIILSVSLAVDQSRFLLLNVVASLFVIICARKMRKRKEVFSACFQAWLISSVVLYAYTLGENQFASRALVGDILASLGFFSATAVLAAGLLPAFEMIFGTLTDMTLMEYMDPSNELLQKMTMEVPGTYQHSLVVGNLSETCAQAIGANGLLCRATSLYHDIGKMLNPQFYTENQQTAVNIHQLLTPAESAQVIISHVLDGEMLAKKYRLPQVFIDIIREHHGTTLVYYFYCKQIELKGGRKEDVDESVFRYPGPKPQTKESAIIMICDTIEAASRSLEIISEQSLAELIDRLVLQKAEDGQFDECNLTFEELRRVKQTLLKALLITRHVRIKYPI